MLRNLGVNFLYHARGNKYILNSQQFFDVYVFVLNSDSLTKRNLHVCVYDILYASVATKSYEKRRVCVSNSKSMVCSELFTYVYVY